MEYQGEKIKNIVESVVLQPYGVCRLFIIIFIDIHLQA